MKAAIDNLRASGGTPTAHAYAEAAAYLMGTNTLKRATIKVDQFKTETKSEFVGYSCTNTSYPNLYGSRCYDRKWDYSITASTNYKNVTRHYQCASWRTTDFINEVQRCSSTGWSEVSGIPNGYEQDGVYYIEEVQAQDSNYSGFNKSEKGAIRDDLNYISPLPAAAQRQSCDGQGVYILSDGEANNSRTSYAEPIMQQALNDTGMSLFGCWLKFRVGLVLGIVWGSLHNIYLIKLKTQQGCLLETAFVGFGNDFQGLAEFHVLTGL